MKLCKFSKSEILEHLILPDCPLGLSRVKSAGCQCKKREYHVPPADLRVVTCTYPNDWRGNPVGQQKTKVIFNMTTEAKTEEPAASDHPFWGLVNGLPLKIRTMAGTGPFGCGKSLLGDMIDPKNTMKVDIESSSTTFNLPFKAHHILFDELSASGELPTPTKCFEWFRDKIESIKPGEFTVVSVDPINEIQQGAYDWVYNHPEKFGRTQGQYDKMSAMVWGDVKTLIEQLIGTLSKKIETFYYVLHEGTVWKNGKPVEGSGGKKAKGSDVFRKIADVVFVLDRPVDPKTGKQVDAPWALITPPIGKSRLVHANPDTGEILPILPPCIRGLSATKIREYIAKPPNYQRLKKDELVPIYHMSDEEKLRLEAEIASDNREAEEMRNERLAGIKDASARNAEAKKIAAGVGDTEVSEPAEKSPEKDSADTSKLPTQEKQNHMNMSKSNLGRVDREAIIKRQFKFLQVKPEQAKKAIAKRGGDGAKLADLTDEQLEDLRVALQAKVTAKEESAKK